MERQRDNAKRRLVSAIGGTLTADEAVTRLDRQAADGTWAYASLIDMRSVTSWLTFDQMARVTRRAQDIARELGPRGPVAIVVANQALIPVGQSHAVIELEAGAAGFSAISKALNDGSTWNNQTETLPLPLQTFTRESLRL